MAILGEVEFFSCSPCARPYRSLQMKSSSLYYYLLKLFSVFVVVFLVCVLIASLTGVGNFGDFIGRDRVMASAYSIFLIPVFCILFWRLGVVDCDLERVEIRRNGRLSEVPWKNVSSINQLPFCAPPIYRIGFSCDEPPVYVMLFTWTLASIGFWSWDFSGFVPFVRSQISRSRDIE